MRNFLASVFLLIALIPPHLWAQAPAVVEGSVINKLTGAPVKGAHVIYNRNDREAGGSSLPISAHAIYLVA